MSTNNESREFAFGRNVWEGCKCPALRAGFEPGIGDNVTYLAEMYDGIVKEDDNRAKGVIAESTAREAWKEMIIRIENHGDFEKASLARDIADTLGWDL